MNFLPPIIAVFLLIISIVDWKYKELPSIILTGMLFVVLALNPLNIFFGLLSLVFALLIYEGDFISGIADIKIITMIGLMITNFAWLSVYTILVLVFGLVWKLIIKKRIKKAKQTAFIPVLFFVFITLWILGGVA
jgi:prepilin signal peptidase PulO-like enzyme (type II secretory pathway)